MNIDKEKMESADEGAQNHHGSGAGICRCVWVAMQFLKPAAASAASIASPAPAMAARRTGRKQRERNHRAGPRNGKPGGARDARPG